MRARRGRLAHLSALVVLATLVVNCVNAQGEKIIVHRDNKRIYIAIDKVIATSYIHTGSFYPCRARRRPFGRWI